MLPLPPRAARATPLLAYRAGAALAGRVPELLADEVARGIGRLLTQTMRSRRAMVTRHQRRLRPGLTRWALRQAVDEAFDSYARYYLESFRLPQLDRATIDAGFRADGYEHVVAGLDAGKGVVLALPHLGGWEWGGRWIADRPHPITVVVEPLEPPELFEWFVSFRKSLGMTVVPLGPGVGTACLRALNANEVLCLLCDRDLDGSGVPVEFFGEVTTLPGGPATLALHTGAPLLPTAIYYRGKGHVSRCGPPLDTTRRGRLREDVARVTQDLAHALERLILAAPTQWHLFQPNWPSDPGYPH